MMANGSNTNGFRSVRWWQVVVIMASIAPPMIFYKELAEVRSGHGERLASLEKGEECDALRARITELEEVMAKMKGMVESGSRE